MNNTTGKYDLDGLWSIGNSDYRLLTSYIEDDPNNLILELGSGQSTFQLADDFPESKVISLER